MDTICSISTGNVESAINIIRVSGPDSINIVNKIFTINLSKKDSHTAHYGHIKYNNDLIDEVIVLLMKAPRTYTKEDVVEINCHGGILVTNKILEILLTNGCRLSEPGEFTKRAFLNGRIDLTQAEAVMDVISAKTNSSLKLAHKSLSGATTKEIDLLINKLVRIIGIIEVNIDYPEYDDVEELTNNELLPLIKELDSDIDKIIINANKGLLLKNGVNTAIVGKPNVGKSSLLNKLSRSDKAIVTNIEGTTRDIIETEIVLNDIKLNLIDTAGIRESEDIVEKIGIDKSLNAINEADLILLLLDNSKPLNEYDNKLLELTKDLNRIIIVNKIDLKPSFTLNEEHISISVKDDINIDKLEDSILSILSLKELQDINYMSNIRHISKIKDSKQQLEEAINGINLGLDIDIVELNLKECYYILNEILGKNATESLLDDLFSNFCLGK